MAIKRVRFSEFKGSYLMIGKLNFYTKIQGQYVAYDVGEKISTVETEKVNITASTLTSAVNTNFLTGGELKQTLGSAPKWVDVTFKEPLQTLQKITYYTRYSASTNMTGGKISIYDENDVLIFEEAMKISPSNLAVVTTLTPDLEIIKNYPVNKIAYIETTDINQIKDIYSINSIEIDCTVPSNTYCRFLFSFDGRKTYKAFDGSQWNVVDKANIIIEGMEYTTVHNLDTAKYNEVLEDCSTLDILTGMMTQHEKTSPTISSIAVDLLQKN